MKGQKSSILRNEDIVIAPMQADLDDIELKALEADLLKAASGAGVTGLVIDVSSVDAIDHFLASKLIAIVRMVALMDVHAVLVGIKPSVAITLTDMNISLSDIKTALNLEKGLALLRQASK